MDNLRRNIDILLILVIGFALRFSISITHSYTNDELSAISRLRYQSFSDLVESGVKTGDMHPAGVQVFEKLWSSLFGTSEIALRFPFVLFGTFSVWIIFLIGKKWFNRQTGIFAASLLSILYFPVEQSELARPYAPGLLISLLTAWYFYKVLIEKTHSYRDAVLLGICFAAGAYTHYFLLLFLLFVGFTALFLVRKETLKYFLLSTLTGVILFLPHLSVTLYHLSVGGLGWLGPPEITFLPDFIFFVFNESWAVTLSLLFLVTLALFNRNHSFEFKTQNYVLCGSWFFGIYLIGHVLSLLSTPVLKPPVMLFSLPFLFLMIAFLLSRLNRARIWTLALLPLLLCSTIIGRDIFGEQYMGFKETARHLVEWNKTYGDPNICTVYNVSNPAYLNFYANRQGDTLRFERDVIEFGDDYQIRKELLERNEPYCVVGYSERLTLPNVFETVCEFYPYTVEYHKYNNSAVFLQSKYEFNALQIHRELFSAMDLFDTGNSNWKINPDLISEDQQTQARTYLLSDENIYGPDFLFRKEEADKLDHYYIKVLVRAVLPDDGQLTVSLSGTRNGELIQHREENFWLGHDLEEMLISTRDSNSIGEAYFAFSIPEYIRDSDELKISLWNRNGKKIQVVSFEIYLAENYWN